MAESPSSPAPVDLREPRELPEGLVARAFSGLVLVYRRTLSPYLGRHCRFRPSCSVYALQALKKHGVLRATALIFRRILRCNPFSAGGFDPP